MCASKATPYARRELDPKNKYRNAHVGVQMQNTCKKGVRPKKQTNGCIRGYTNAQPTAKRELDPRGKYKDVYVGIRT